MDEIILILAMSLLAVIAAVIAYVAGKYTDPIARAKMLRRVLRKNYITIGVVSKDHKTVRYKCWNAKSDVMNVNGKLWVGQENRIYRKDKTEEGFGINENTPIHFEEGVPVIYVDEDTIKPIDFYPEKEVVKPAGLSEALNAWNLNQLAKGLAQVQQLQLLLYVILAIAAIGAYFAFDADGKAAKALDASTWTVNTLNSSTVFNPSAARASLPLVSLAPDGTAITIKQPTKKPGT